MRRHVLAALLPALPRTGAASAPLSPLTSPLTTSSGLLARGRSRGTAAGSSVSRPARPAAAGSASGAQATDASILPQQELKQLEAALAKHQDLYFNQQPEISDAAYDELKRRFRRLSAQQQGVREEDVELPVGSPVASALRKAPHRVPMLSLAAVNSRDETAAWMAKTLAKLPAPPRRQQYGWVVEPKVDGLAVRVVYRRTAAGVYELEEAATRGDGAVGEDVTHNALHAAIRGLPRSLAPQAGQDGPAPPPPWVEVRGEVFVRLEDLEQVNQAQVAAGQAPFANARNLAAGALRLLDTGEARRRRLSFVAYAALAPPAGSAVEAEARPLFDSHWRVLSWLQSAGLAVSPDNALCGSPEAALEAAEAWMERRGSLGYDADGVVFKLDDTRLYDELGVAGSDPRWAVAWKFPASEAVTRLAGVELTVGRLGQVTPVALLEPVALGGVTIRRASLHNAGLAAGLGLHLGDAVVVRRSGDVIPQVIRVLPELRPAGAAPWQPPTACPACGGPLQLQPAAKVGSGDQLLCRAPDCPAKSERTLLHFAETVLKGSNVAKQAVPLLVEAGLLEAVPDFYRLDMAELAALPGFGPAKAASLAAALEASRRLPLGKVVQGLNIRLVGPATAAKLGAAYASLPELAAAAERGGAGGIAAASGVGPAVATAVAAWITSPVGRSALQGLVEAGVGLGGAPGPGGSRPSSTRSTQEASVTAQAEVQVEEEEVRPKAKARPRASAAAASAPAAAEPSTGARASVPAAATSAPAPASAADAGAEGLRGMRGLNVCITGTLKPEGADDRGVPTLSRNEMAGLLEAAGATVQATCTTATNVLIAGASSGQKKLDAAARKGVRVVPYAQFWKEHGFPM
ncbi:hypothetical protein HYH03_013971 [Edaphochlamys debaryana]|uniref:DNA ligase (NAD(+)) n=1 Tax=Edaphochlamys debaryana TaxID=47281 RepID=A0A835XPX9_9CHLO|nr:hypothetical protein HYH03_013971 [Edaphochlamys debaryana]|eukprot:KAG2487402.1 hypothetical protein HYH03_013971 [Edaphochlamys debaryana]